MKLNDDGTAETHWEDENGAEWEVLILFTYQESEPMEPNPDHPMFGPGCDQEIVDIEVMRNEPVYDVKTWYDFDGYTEREAADWKTEILELINSDDRG